MICRNSPSNILVSFVPSHGVEHLSVLKPPFTWNLNSTVFCILKSSELLVILNMIKICFHSSYIINLVMSSLPQLGNILKFKCVRI